MTIAGPGPENGWAGAWEIPAPPPATFDFPPMNDRACLDAATLRAYSLALTPAAAQLARQLGTMGDAVWWLRGLPQRDDDGAGPRGDQPTIACNVPQRARGFAGDPNCFERSIAFQALASHLQPALAVRLGTLAVTGTRAGVPVAGLHTVPFAWSGRDWEIVDLNPGARGRLPSFLDGPPTARNNFLGDLWGSISKIGDDISSGNADGKDIWSAIHQGGRTVATAFGYGSAADALDGIFKSQGWVNK
jgi:hypothetical protein